MKSLVFLILMSVFLEGCSMGVGKVTNLGSPSGVYPKMTPEIRAICDEYGGLQIYDDSIRSVKEVVIQEASACGPQCRLLLLAHNFERLESETSRFHAGNYKGNLSEDRRDLRGNALLSLVDEAGWHRFERVRWDDPRAERYREGLSTRDYRSIPLYKEAEQLLDDPVALAALQEREDNSLLGKAVISTRIEGPSFRYRIKKETYFDDYVLNGAIRVTAYGETLKDHETDTLIASKGVVDAAVVGRDRRGKVVGLNPAAIMCGGYRSFDSKEIAQILRPDG